MKKATFLLSISLIFLTLSGFAQSAAMYICNNCTYKTPDGRTLTLNKNGSVLKDGVLVNGMKCDNIDGTVTLYLNGKETNKLRFEGMDKCDLKDKKNKCYELISCNPNASEVNSQKNTLSKFKMPEELSFHDKPFIFYTDKSISELTTIFKAYCREEGFYSDENTINGYGKKQPCYLIQVSKGTKGNKIQYSWECD